MEVKPGYKRTEVGVIPEDWSLKRLNNLLLQPATYGIVKAGNFQNQGIPMLRGGDIKFGRVNSELPKVSLEKSEEYKRTILKANDVVIALVGYPGETAVIPDDLIGANISRAVGLLRPSNSLDSKYLTCYLNSDIGRTEFLKPGAGSAQFVVNLKDLNKLIVPIPENLEEQQAIAEALSDADVLIESLERLIAKKRQIKQGAMQELLTGKRRLSGYSGEWNREPFKNVLLRSSKNTNKINASKYQLIGRYPVIDQGQKYIIAYSDDIESCYRIKNDGVIIFGDHTCIVKYIDFDFIIGADGTQVIESQENQCSKFHYYQLQNEGITPTGYNRHFRLLTERQFIVPTFAEQSAIAAVLSDMDAEIDALETKLAKARAVKQGMMQELLTGRIRLV